MNYLANLHTPQLEKIHSGKVRESFRVDDNTRMIVATDRLSSFDKVLRTPIPGKGAVLNGISSFWFAKTEDIIGNHFIEQIDPNISLVHEAIPIRIEMVVRGYLTGSMWRYYQKGKREFSGVKVTDDLKQNQAFDKPILTPTTKEESDREINPQKIVAQGWTTKKIYEQMERVSLALYERGRQFLASKNLILVDTKYEFGLINNKLVLIDEIHTPDSSRFWQANDYEKNPENCKQMDKEFVRHYLLNHKINDDYPDTLPEYVVKETINRYQTLYEIITGQKPISTDEDIQNRIYHNLVKHELIKDSYVAIIMGSIADIEHCKKMKSLIENYNLMVDMRVVSAHKNGEELISVIEDYNHSVEPGAVIAVAGLSNGLGGALAANLTIPVFNCPPFKDLIDMQMNINSSLMMPSNTPAATVVKPESAALIAMRSLNLQRLRSLFKREISEMKIKLREDDNKARGRR